MEGLTTRNFCAEAERQVKVWERVADFATDERPFNNCQGVEFSVRLDMGTTVTFKLTRDDALLKSLANHARKVINGLEAMIKNIGEE